MYIIFDYGPAFLLALGLFTFTLVFYHILFRHLTGEVPKVLNKRIKIPVYLMILVISLIIFIKYLPEDFETNIYEHYLSFFKYISLSVLGVELLSFLIFDYIWLKTRTGAVPTIFRDIIKFIIYTTIIIFILSIFNINIAPFLTTAGILTMVIGLALQDTLGNVFSGLAMQFSGPFREGDIIEIGDIKGRIEKIDWRSTYIYTRMKNYVIVPHSTMSKLEIKNFTRPRKRTMRRLTVGLSYNAPTSKVRRIIMDVLKNMEAVTEKHECRVFVQSFDDFTVTYEIEFPLEMISFDHCEQVESDVMERIFYRFKKEGIEIPFPIRNVYHYRPPKKEDTVPELVSILKKVDFLCDLSEEKLKYLALNSDIEYFIPGDTICKQGEKGDSFYIIKSGEAEVYILIEEEETKVAVLKENDFFGEISLLTGETRTATIKVSENSEMLVLTKEDFVELLTKEPSLAENMSRVIVYRQSRDKVQHSKIKTDRLAQEEEEEKKRQQETLTQQFFNKIKNFFSL